MKQLIAPIAIIVALIAFFVVIDRKDFYSGGDVAVQKEAVTGKKPTTETTLKPVEKPAEANPSEVKPTETKPVETKPMVETKPVETKPAETKPVKTTPVAEEKLAPAVIPVVTAEEAKKLNAEAMVFAEKHARRMFFAGKGMELVYDDKMNTYTSVSIAASFDDTFKKNGVVKSRSDLLTRKVPNGWTIDYNTLKGNCDFNRKDNTYEISSPDGVLKINTPARLVLNTATGISVELTGKTPETKVRLGIEELGMFRPGKTYVGELSGEFEEECINYEISALEHYDNVRPFLEITGDVTILGLRIYQKELTGTTYLEGEIVERSALPDPKKSDYPNCRYTAQFVGNVIKGGVACPKEMALVVDGFEDYKTLRTDTLKKGDKIICSVIPYDTLSEEEQSVQQADDLNLFTLENYYVLGVRKLNAFADGDNALFPASGVHFLDEQKEHVSIINQHINPPISKDLQEAQARTIAEDLAEINEMLKDYDEEKIKEVNASFAQAWKAEKEKDTSGHNVVTVDTSNAKIIWRQLDNSFFSITPGTSSIIATTTVSEDNLNALIELKKVLEANGVQLILSIIQTREPIVARIINEDFRSIPDYHMYNNIRILLEHGIEAIAPSKDSVLRYNEEEFLYNVGNDGHPSILIQKLVSEILAKRLERYNIPKRLRKDLFSFQEEKHTFYGYDPLRTWPENCDIGSHKPGDEIKVKKPVLPKEYSYLNNDSEVLVIGNSFTVSPYTSGYGLVSWLSYSLETDVSYYHYSMNGPATVFINNLLIDPEKYLKGKKVCIIQFAMSHLLSVQWHNISTLDRQLTLLTSTKPISMVPVIPQENVGLPNLSDKQMTTIGLLKGHNFRATTQEFEIANSTIETNNKKSLIVIPSCLISGKVTISVNGDSQLIPSSPDTSTNSYQSLIFEIPAETKEVSITVTGNNNSVFIIKDIELWQ